MKISRNVNYNVNIVLNCLGKMTKYSLDFIVF